MQEVKCVKEFSRFLRSLPQNLVSLVLQIDLPMLRPGKKKMLDQCTRVDLSTGPHVPGSVALYASPIPLHPGLCHCAAGSVWFLGCLLRTDAIIWMIMPEPSSQSHSCVMFSVLTTIRQEIMTYDVSLICRLGADWGTRGLGSIITEMRGEIYRLTQTNHCSRPMQKSGCRGGNRGGSSHKWGDHWLKGGLTHQKPCSFWKAQ